jgi:hypothetical protein
MTNFRSILRNAAWACLTLLAIAAAPAALAADDVRYQWQGVERVVAFADVHGAYAELTQLLREAGIIDAQGRWSAGRTHVVSLGDLLDRGADSRKVMDLLMRLQGEAAAAGGRLHVVIGNHEAMNVIGNLRYVVPGEFAAYQDVESAETRAAQLRAWQAVHGPDSATTFAQAFPPGFFGHRAALGPSGRYGKWLLEQPVAIVLNDTLFMHAGPSKALVGMSLPELNQRYRRALDDYLASERPLELAGLLQPDDAFDARPGLAAERLAARAALAGGAAPPGLAQAVQQFAAADASPMLNQVGPNWYRGPAQCNEVAEADVLEPLLAQLGATRLVIGHTPTRDQRVATRFDGKVVKLDAGMNRAVYRGRAAALQIEDGRMTVRYAGEPGSATPVPEGLYVAPNELDEATILAALRDGTVTAGAPRAPGAFDVTVEHLGRRFPAVFMSKGTGASRKELAAYRLDRLLRLGLVPATVARDVQGQPGVLQARPEKWVTQGDVQRQSLRGGRWCALEPQFQLVYAFDSLIGNNARTAETLLFDTDEWYVYVTGHDQAFGTDRNLPAYLKARPPQPGAELRRRLAALDEKSLAAALGDAVDGRARKSIISRRDLLIALPSTGAAATGK